MHRILSWIQANKLAALLLLVVGYFVYQQYFGYSPFYFGDYASKSSYSSYDEGYSVVGGAPMAFESAGIAADRSIGIAEPDFAPSSSSDRLVIRDTSMSLQVEDVSASLSKIEKAAEDAGGYMVNSNVNVPEEAASGSITIRVPEDKRAEVLASFRDMAVKVVSENVSGRDVTDQYEDISAQLATHTKVKQKFESILDQATEVTNLLEVQRELINVQRQIDNLKGRQEYLEQSAQLSKITVYLATDEFALPYTPDESWRPEVVFKTAVRSLVSTFRSLADTVIWIVVYAPVWVVAYVVYRWWRRRSITA